MSGGDHRVRRLRWRIRLGSREEAFELRPGLADVVTAAIVPELERSFDALGAGDEVVHIDRLEVKVRIDTVDALETATLAAIRAAFAGALNDWPTDHERGSGAETPVRRATLRSSRLGSLVHYLETGTLPWYAEPVAADPAHGRELEETAVSEMTEVLQRLPAAPAETAVFLFRLMSLLPEAAWTSVVHAVARHRHRLEEPALVEAVERIATAPERSSARHARLELAAAIIAGWFAPAERSEPRPSPIKTPVSSDALRLFDRLALPTRLAQPIDTPRRPSELWRHSGEPASSPAEAESAAVTFRVLVFYAGLTLLAPFIPRLFAARNVAHPGEKVLNPEAARRAAALLHYAATGEDEGHEYELGFIKILLGLPIDRPILFASGILSRGDRGHVDALLTDVLDEWGVPRHTVSEGIRSAFLQRRGLLADTGTSWHLRVEAAPIDELLDRLPWRLSDISLPWLNRPLEVDWRRP